MIDRFRFRAWLKDRKKYDYDIEDCFEDWVFENFGQYLKDKDVIVEQCIGLKDKNGKLIYEGDIVIKDKQKFEAYYDDSLLGYYLRSNNIVTVFVSNTELEIIGNIHENKELLDDNTN